MNRKISRLQTAEKSLIKNHYALISVRPSLETAPTNGKLKFDSKNNDLKINCSNSSGNNNDNNNE